MHFGVTLITVGQHTSKIWEFCREAQFIIFSHRGSNWIKCKNLIFIYLIRWMLFMSFLLHIHIWCHKMLNKYVQGIVALTWTPLKRLLFTVSSCAYILNRKQSTLFTYLMQCRFKKCVLGIVALTKVYPNMLTGLPYKASRLPDNCAIFYSTSCLSTTSFTTWWFWEQKCIFSLQYPCCLYWRWGVTYCFGFDWWSNSRPMNS